MEKEDVDDRGTDLPGRCDGVEGERPVDGGGSESEQDAVQNSSLAGETADDDPRDAVVTLDDVLAEEEELEQQADALLGSQDDSVCTYPEGYKPRQALYACRTCRAEHDSHLPAGVCFGCATHCHDGHDLVELYTKRNFCCDCGNGKFKRKCKLYEEKKALNERNAYNENFAGIYCVCAKPYPSDDDTDGEMLQCIVCEDWFHAQHLETAVPSEFAEMVCFNCAKRLPFLAVYAEGGEFCAATSATTENPPTIDPQAQGEVHREPKKTLFFPTIEWRNSLCKCDKCTDLYDECGCAYLVDIADTVQAYENADRPPANGERKNETDLVDRLLQDTDRDVAIHMIQGVVHLKERLQGFLKRFADANVVVEKTHIDAFFNELREEREGSVHSAAKRPRVDVEHGSHP